MAVRRASACSCSSAQNSPAVRRYAGIWLGVQDDTVELHGTRRADFIGFEADVPRRDAVVEAFKVRARALSSK